MILHGPATGQCLFQRCFSFIPANSSWIGCCTAIAPICPSPQTRNNTAVLASRSENAQTCIFLALCPGKSEFAFLAWSAILWDLTAEDKLPIRCISLLRSQVAVVFFQQELQKQLMVIFSNFPSSLRGEKNSKYQWMRRWWDTGCTKPTTAQHSAASLLLTGVPPMPRITFTFKRLLLLKILSQISARLHRAAGCDKTNSYQAT